MMQTVQLSIADSAYASAVRQALSRNCAWHVDAVKLPDPARRSVLVLDEAALHRLPLPLFHPGRIVLICGRDEPSLLAEALDAGIVSVVSQDAPMDTVLLAIMAAALRVPKFNTTAAASEISPSAARAVAAIPPEHACSGSKITLKPIR